MSQRDRRHFPDSVCFCLPFHLTVLGRLFPLLCLTASVWMRSQPLQSLISVLLARETWSYIHRWSLLLLLRMWDSSGTGNESLRGDICPERLLVLPWPLPTANVILRVCSFLFPWDFKPSRQAFFSGNSDREYRSSPANPEPSVAIWKQARY